MNDFLHVTAYLSVNIRLNPSLPIADQLAVRDRVIERVNTALAAYMLAWLPEEVTATADPVRWEYHIPLRVYATGQVNWRTDLAALQDESLSVVHVSDGLFVDIYQTQVLTAFNDALEAFTQTLQQSNNEEQDNA